MKNYFFFTGRQDELAHAELEAVFHKRPHNYHRGVSSLELDDLSPDIQARLGGTVKIAEELFVTPSSHAEKDIKEYLESVHESGKLTLAVNLYGERNEDRILRKLLMGIKKKLPFSVRFCNNNFKNITSVVTGKQVLKKQGGIELNLISQDGAYIVARTISCQDVDAYSLRDYEKPIRDAKIGMLPPKLAQMLLNFVGDYDSVWDPFCGSGTVLAEASLQKKKSIGSDLNPLMVSAAQQNMDWLSEKFDLGDYKIFEHDATKSISIDADVIVTEGYLGEPKRRLCREPERSETDAMLSELYVKFFRVAKQNNIKRVILCLPLYKMPGRLGFMKKTLASIEQTGYNPQALSQSERKSLIYSRPDQFVFREIFSFHLA